jgi:hypothetical protein
MPLGGAFANPETNAVLRKLTEVVKAAAARPVSAPRPKAARGRRPGWVGPLVLAVLQAATEPLTTTQVVHEIKQRFRKQIAYDSVRHVLRFGKEAQVGLIERAGRGRYVARRAH